MDVLNIFDTFWDEGVGWLIGYTSGNFSPPIVLYYHYNQDPSKNSDVKTLNCFLQCYWEEELSKIDFHGGWGWHYLITRNGMKKLNMKEYAPS